MNGEYGGTKVILDFSAAAGIGEVHEVLKEGFGFPKYYGKNWDALHDCLEDFAMDIGEGCVEIRGLSAMDDWLKKKCEPMLQVFEDIRKEYPGMRFVTVS